MAVAGAQILALFIAVYGFLMAPLGWTYAGIVWGYCAVQFFVQDVVKLGIYRVLGEEHSGYFGRHVRPES
jgi:H+-transporting ATPase